MRVVKNAAIQSMAGAGLPLPPLGFDYTDEAARQRFFDEATIRPEPPLKLTRKQRRLVAQLKRRRK